MRTIDLAIQTDMTNQLRLVTGGWHPTSQIAEFLKEVIRQVDAKSISERLLAAFSRCSEVAVYHLDSGAPVNGIEIIYG